jgi:hypothetical protein
MSVASAPSQMRAPALHPEIASSADRSRFNLEHRKQCPQMTRIESRLNHKTAALPPGWRSDYRAVVHATYLASDWLSRRHKCLGVCARPFSHADSSSPQFLAYHRMWRGTTPVVFEDEPETLPRYLADKFGWVPMTQKTAVDCFLRSSATAI